jgi:hypothetical protein
MHFLRDCLRRMTTVRFADPATGRVLARLDRGRVTSLAPTVAETDTIVHRVLTNLGGIPSDVKVDHACEVLRMDEARTLGAWGSGAHTSSR